MFWVKKKTSYSDENSSKRVVFFLLVLFIRSRFAWVYLEGIFEYVEACSVVISGSSRRGASTTSSMCESLYSLLYTALSSAFSVQCFYNYLNIRTIVLFQ